MQSESVADYSGRIENLLRRATQNRFIEEGIRNEMLCSKLWNGLKDPLLKNSSRYKFEVDKDLNSLRKSIRSIEQDLNTSDITKQMSTLTSSVNDSQCVKVDKQSNQMAQSSFNSTGQKLVNIANQMKMLRERMDGLEKKFSEACLASQSRSPSTTQPGSHIPPTPPVQRCSFTQSRALCTSWFFSLW